MITLTGQPIDEGFHIGLFVTFIGRAVFIPAVDTSTVISVSSIWSSPRAASTTSAKQDGTNPLEYIASLSVDLESTREDRGLYAVTFYVTSGPFIIGVSVNGSRSITVQCELLIALLFNLIF